MSETVPARGAQDGVAAWATVAAHQVGGALALIRGAAMLLDGSRDRLGPEGADALGALRAGSDRAQRFVDDLVDLVRSADPPFEDDDDPSAELDPALDAAVQALAGVVGSRGTTLVREPLPAAGIDGAEAERLFAHLLRMAAAAGAREIRVVAVPAEDGAAVVEVLDDGAPAVDGSSLGMLPTPRGRGELVGAGVSLLVCRNLVERRGGTLEVVSREDGTTATRLTLRPGR